MRCFLPLAASGRHNAALEPIGVTALHLARESEYGFEQAILLFLEYVQHKSYLNDFTHHFNLDRPLVVLAGIEC